MSKGKKKNLPSINTNPGKEPAVGTSTEVENLRGKFLYQQKKNSFGEENIVQEDIPEEPQGIFTYHFTSEFV